MSTVPSNNRSPCNLIKPCNPIKHIQLLLLLAILLVSLVLAHPSSAHQPVESKERGHLWWQDSNGTIYRVRAAIMYNSVIGSYSLSGSHTIDDILRIQQCGIYQYSPFQLATWTVNMEETKNSSNICPVTRLTLVRSIASRILKVNTIVRGQLGGYDFMDYEMTNTIIVDNNLITLFYFRPTGQMSPFDTRRRDFIDLSQVMNKNNNQLVTDPIKKQSQTTYIDDSDDQDCGYGQKLIIIDYVDPTEPTWGIQGGSIIIIPPTVTTPTPTPTPTSTPTPTPSSSSNPTENSTGNPIQLSAIPQPVPKVIPCCDIPNNLIKVDNKSAVTTNTIVSTNNNNSNTNTSMGNNSQLTNNNSSPSKTTIQLSFQQIPTSLNSQPQNKPNPQPYIQSQSTPNSQQSSYPVKYVRSDTPKYTDTPTTYPPPNYIPTTPPPSYPSKQITLLPQNYFFLQPNQQTHRGVDIKISGKFILAKLCNKNMKFQYKYRDSVYLKVAVSRQQIYACKQNRFGLRILIGLDKTEFVDIYTDEIVFYDSYNAPRIRLSPY